MESKQKEIQSHMKQCFWGGLLLCGMYFIPIFNDAYHLLVFGGILLILSLGHYIQLKTK